MWQQIGIDVLTSTVITGIYVVILGEVIKSKFQKDIELYKHKLKTESDKELAEQKHQSELQVTRLTNELQLKAAERNIKLTKVFDRQAEVIGKIHENLFLVFDIADTYINRVSGKPKEIRQKQLEEIDTAFRIFDDYFRPNSIYLPLETAELTRRFCDTYSLMLSSLDRSNDLLFTQQVSELSTRMYEKNEAELGKLSTEATELLSKLKSDFRNLLGMMPEKKCALVTL